MQQSQFENVSSSPLDMNSSSSTSMPMNTLNGIFSIHRLSQTSVNVSSLVSNNIVNQSRVLSNDNNQFNRLKQIKHILLNIILTVTFSFLLMTTIELAGSLVKNYEEKTELLRINVVSNLTQINNNQTRFNVENNYSIYSLFACIWLFNLFLFLICLIVHLYVYQRDSQHSRARAAFLR